MKKADNNRNNNKNTESTESQALVGCFQAEVIRFVAFAGNGKTLLERNYFLQRTLIL